LTAKQLISGTEKGYNKNILDTEWNSTDFKTLDNFTKNIYHFSAAKNYQELKDISEALRDGSHIRTFDEFKDIVQDITGKYNENWLRSEYNQAVAASQASSKWNDILANKEDMPYLQYEAVMDSNTREGHALLNGIIKRYDDPFWDIYMPPNDFGCRCEANQLSGDNYTETLDKDIIAPDIPEMFQLNFGKESIIFPETHPYYIDIPDKAWKVLDIDTKSSVNRYYDKVVMEWAKEKVGDKPFSIELKNFVSGKLEVSMSDVREIINHASGSNKILAKECLEILPELKLLKKDVKLEHESKFHHFNYYSLKIGKDEYNVNVGVFKSGQEKLYAITKKRA